MSFMLVMLQLMLTCSRCTRMNTTARFHPSEVYCTVNRILADQIQAVSILMQ